MWQNGLKWMFLIIGTTIGAGYASGREIWQFFGKESGLAIVLFTIMFIICCQIVMKISHEQKSSHYLPVLRILVGKKLASFYDAVIIFYLFTTTAVMIAGGGATLEMFHFSKWSGIILCSVLLILLFFWETNGFVSMNALIIPVLICSLFFTLVYFVGDEAVSLGIDLEFQKNWPSAFTFTAFNILPIVAVLAAIGKEMKHKGEGLIASIGGGLILGGISYIYNESLIHISAKIPTYEIPLFGIIEEYPYFMVLLMTLIIWIAIYSTAASGVFGLITRIRGFVNMPLWSLAFITVLCMLPFTALGFSKLVALLYPLYGIINLYLLSAILLYPFTNRYK